MELITREKFKTDIKSFQRMHLLGVLIGLTAALVNLGMFCNSELGWSTINGFAAVAAPLIPVCLLGVLLNDYRDREKKIRTLEGRQELTLEYEKSPEAFIKKYFVVKSKKEAQLAVQDIDSIYRGNTLEREYYMRYPFERRYCAILKYTQQNKQITLKNKEDVYLN